MKRIPETDWWFYVWKVVWKVISDMNEKVLHCEIRLEGYISFDYFRSSALPTDPAKIIFQFILMKKWEMIHYNGGF